MGNTYEVWAWVKLAPLCPQAQAEYAWVLYWKGRWFISAIKNLILAKRENRYEHKVGCVKLEWR